MISRRSKITDPLSHGRPVIIFLKFGTTPGMTVEGPCIDRPFGLVALHSEIVRLCDIPPVDPDAFCVRQADGIPVGL